MANEEPPGPRWAVGLDAPSTRRVRNLVAQELRARGVEQLEFVEDGVEWRDASGGTSLAPLADLAYRCAASDPSAWSSLVEQGVGELLEVDGGDHPTLREGQLTAQAVRELYPRPEPLISEPPPAPRWRDPALEESAPPGGMRSPFARTQPRDAGDAPLAPAPRAIASDLRATWEGPGAPSLDPGDGARAAPSDGEDPWRAMRPEAGAPTPEVAQPKPPLEGGGDAWAEAEDASPPRRRPSRLRRLGVAVVVLAFVATGLLELRAFIVEPEAPDHWASPSNDVLLEATPSGKVMVVAEEDGRTLGPAPLRILVPPGPEISVLLTAPGRTPKRVVLPTSGRVMEHLNPRLPNEPTCTVRLPTAGTWQYQTVLGNATSSAGQIDIEGSAVVRVIPEGYGAWIVTCPPEGGTVELDLERRFPPMADIRAQRPRGALLHVNERPIGKIPVRWTQARAFSHLRLRTVSGEYVARWLATPGSIGVELPADESLAPPVTLPRTAVESPVPYYLRENDEKKKSAADDLDVPLLPEPRPDESAERGGAASPGGGSGVPAARRRTEGTERH